MGKLILTVLIFTLFSCSQKDPTKAQYLERAIRGNDYKIVSSNFQRVNDSLKLIKKHPLDTNAVIYEYNTIAGSSTIQVKTMSDLIKQMDAMNKDSSFLKSVQSHLADKLAKDHQDSTRSSK